MKIKVIIALAIISSAAVCSKHKSDHWSYDGEEGPSHWGDLKQEFEACKTGHKQSPINITGNTESTADTPVFSYSKVGYSIIDNGHTIQANVKEGSFMELDGKKYALKQIHFHSTSENHLNGRSYPMEGHLVHKADDGELAVVGIFFNASPDAKINPELEKIWSHIPSEKEKDTAVEGDTIDLSALFPADKSMFRFEGSLTTPPCSEGVKWNVFKSAVILPESEIIAFQKHYDHNARPVQELYGRKISIARIK